MSRAYILCLFLFIAFGAFAQRKTTQIEINSSYTGSNGLLTPMWLWANNWGRFSEGLEFYGCVGDTLLRFEKFYLKGGLAGVYQEASNTSYLHEGYVAGQFYNIDFSAGLQAYSPWIYNDNLTTGIYLGSSNARPIPRLSIGFNNYVYIPLTDKWLQIKGGISQGVLNDYQYMDRGHHNDLLHEKFAYLRLTHFKIKPYAGLMHSVLYGGENIETDFIATFFGEGSDKLGGGEATNAAGAHMGLYDFGVDWIIGNWQTKLYLQKPFADGSGMLLNKGLNKDFIAGVLIEKGDGRGIINGLSLEVMDTRIQSGEGFPDPYDKDLVNPNDPSQVGMYFFPGSIDDPAAFMAKYYPSVEASGWDKDDIVSWLKTKVNRGNEFGGRDDLMNNGTYYAGWSYFGRSMGTPLYHNAEQVKAYAPEWEFSDQGTYFVNNRVSSIHLGVSGEYKQIRYRLKSTLTMNYGSYSRMYEGRSSWQVTEDYFYEDGLFQGYYGLEISRPVTRSGVFVLKGNFGCDAGELYNSFGATLGLSIFPR